MEDSRQPALLEARRPESLDLHMAMRKYVFHGVRSTPTVTVFNFVPKVRRRRLRRATARGPDCDRIRRRGSPPCVPVTGPRSDKAERSGHIPEIKRASELSRHDNEGCPYNE
jgi:hypothetical protein